MTTDDTDGDATANTTTSHLPQTSGSEPVPEPIGCAACETEGSRYCPGASAHWLHGAILAAKLPPRQMRLLTALSSDPTSTSSRTRFALQRQPLQALIDLADLVGAPVADVIGAVAGRPSGDIEPGLLSVDQQRARVTAWLVDAAEAGLDIDELGRNTGWPAEVSYRVLASLTSRPPPGLRLDKEKIGDGGGNRYVLRADPDLLVRAPAREIPEESAELAPYPHFPLDAAYALHAACSGTPLTDADRGVAELLDRGFLDPSTMRPTTDVQFSLQWYR